MRNSKVDVLLITALKDEHDAVLDMEPGWVLHKDSSGFTYHIKEFSRNSGQVFSVALARPIDMGGYLALNVATRLVKELKPGCLSMIGICAGWRGKVFLGDVIVAERVFHYDAGKLKALREGAVRKEDVFQDIRTYNLKPLWVQKAQDFSTKWITTIKANRPLTYHSQELWLLYALHEFETEGTTHPIELPERKMHCPDWPEVLKRLEKKHLITVDRVIKLTETGESWIAEYKTRYPDGIPPEPDKPRIYVAPMGTGSQVKEDPELFPIIAQHVRKVLAIEMEAAAIGAVAEIENVDFCIIVKGVSDHADHEKDDHFRFYAIEASYRFLIAFLQDNLPQELETLRIPFILPQLDVSSFTGREDELRQLEKLILKPEGTKLCSIAGLTGSGGIGKSAIACHFAQLHKAQFPDGVIGLRADQKDIDTLAREFARTCGQEIGPDDERDASVIMQEVFANRRALLIFDNAVDASIRSLLPGGNKCAVIITTRDRGLPVVLGSPVEGRIDIDILSNEDSILLLEKLIGTNRVQNEIEAAQKIIKLVGNLPLALQIVGATLQMQDKRSLIEYLELLSKERNRLEKLKIRGDKYLDVRASFMLSLELLQSNEVDLFASLSVCAKDGFSVQTASAAAGCDKGIAGEILHYLHRLSLINQSASNRYLFHTLIHLFAQEVARERNLENIARERHSRFFLDFVKSKDLTDPSISRFVEDELEDILLAVEWSQEQNLADYELSIKLGVFFQRHGQWRRAINLMKGFLALAERGEDWNAIVQLRIQQSKYHLLCGELAKAYDILEPISDILSRIQDEEVRYRTKALWLNTFGGVLQRQGKFDEAVDAFKRSQAIREKMGDEVSLAMVLISLGGALQRQGKFDEAVDAFKRSQAISEKMGDEVSLAMVLTSLGGVLQRQGKFNEAVDAFKRSQAISEKMGDERGLAIVLTSLGGVLQRQGKFNEAVDAFKRSQAIREKMGDEVSLAMVLNSLGGVLQRQGKFNEAVDAFKRSYVIGEKLGDERHLAMVLTSLGGVLQRQGKFDEAVDAFKRSQAISEKMGDEVSLAMVLNSLGGVLRRQGKFDEAVDTIKRSQAISEKMGDERGLAMVLDSLSGVLERQGKFDEAVDAIKQSQAIIEKLGDERGLAMVLNSLGGVLQRQGKFNEAINALRDSCNIGIRLNDKKHLAIVHTTMGRALLAHGDFEEASLELAKGFEFDEIIKNGRGIDIVTPLLVEALLRTNKRDQAALYCERALLVSPKNRRILNLYEKLRHNSRRNND